jgi:hypothetical protein
VPTFIHSGEFGSGVTNGTGITNANAPSGSDNFTSVTEGATGSAEFSSTHVLNGSGALRFLSTAAADRAHITWSGYTVDTISARFYAYFTAFSGTQTIFAAQSSGSVRVVGVAVTSSGYVNVTDQGGTVDASSSPLSTNTWYRFEVTANRTSPAIDVSVYAGNGTSVLTSLSVSPFAPTPTMGSAQIDRVVFGKYSTSATFDFWMDDLAVVTGSTTPIGPAVGGTPHYELTTNHTPDTTTFSSWTLDTTSSVGTTTLTQTSGTSVGTITESPADVYTFSNPGGTDDLVFTLTATNGGTSADTTITLSRATGTERPYRWTFQGGDATVMGNWA